MSSSSPVLLVKSGGAAALPEWRASFHEFAPGLGLEVCAWDDPEVDPARVEYVLVWQPEAGRLARFPNLKAIFSSAAGVDHILADPHLPDLPIVRMVTPETQQRMAEFTQGKTVLLVTHRTSMLSFVDRVIVVDQGKIVADGPRERILQALSAGRIARAS